MTRWYVKELSQLTQVSVRTLHHYDAIGLLKPGLRLDTGYRLYSESDLLKLQQIIALKFFGFKLASIKTLLDKNIDVYDHFSAQAQCLEEQSKALLKASQTLKAIISEANRNKSIPWESIIKSIEVFRMTQQLEKSWIAKALSPEQLNDFAKFELSLKTRFSEADRAKFDQKWQALIAEISSHLDEDPCSELGWEFGKKMMDMINTLYGKQFAELKSAIWQQGFMRGKAGSEHPLSPKHIAWLDKAFDSYYRHRIYHILSQTGKATLADWTALTDEMYGDSRQLKAELFQAVMDDEKIDDKAKEWLRMNWCY
ncbi:MAG: MerR family transcriptional regulator [Tatlockia sp.]|nr:MerR family transcriptional regulator [Tatlockia sp.]